MGNYGERISNIVSGNDSGANYFKGYVIWVQIIIAVLALAVLLPRNTIQSQELIALDPNGLIVTLKEKYGPAIQDTGTVVIEYKNQYVIVRRNGPSGRYPIANWAIIKIEEVGDGTD